MNHQAYIATIIITILLLLMAFSPPAVAQIEDPQGHTGGGYNPGIFHIPNFEGDRRSPDLYRWLHPVPNPYWKSYRTLEEQIAQQSNALPPGWGVGMPNPNQPITNLGSPVDSFPPTPPYIPQDSKSVPVGVSVVPGLVSSNDALVPGINAGTGYANNPLPSNYGNVSSVSNGTEGFASGTMPGGSQASPTSFAEPAASGSNSVSNYAPSGFAGISSPAPSAIPVHTYDTSVPGTDNSRMSPLPRKSRFR